MKVEMRELREGPVTLEINCSPSAIDLADDEFRFDQPITGKVTFQLVGHKVLARGRLQTVATTDCVRCLTKVDAGIEAEVDAVYENDPELLKPESKVIGNADHSINWFDGESISPEQELRESLMLELPSLPICDEACKGLCPVCGGNLNSQSCKCSNDKVEVSPWKAALKDIKLD